MKRRALDAAALLAAGLGVRRVLRPGGRPRKVLRSSVDRVAKELRYRAGVLQGLSYRMRGGRPDPDVPDAVLADRVRSTLGPLEKRLDVPRVHVMVKDRIAMLHGDVASEHEASEIERAVARVSGVMGVESYLHVGLLPSDTLPSEGRAQREASDAYRRLVGAARGAGIPDEAAPRVTRAVLAAFVARVPEGERGQVLTHLPPDARALADPLRALGEMAERARTVDGLVQAALSAAGDIEPALARHVLECVVGALRGLVPEEVADVSAVLPRELRELWEAAVPG